MVLVTKVIVRLMRKPEMVKILAIYESSEDAGRTVAEITARAITPVAVEMLDGVMLRMVEEATHAGYPMDAAFCIQAIPAVRSIAGSSIPAGSTSSSVQTRRSVASAQFLT